MPAGRGQTTRRSDSAQHASLLLAEVYYHSSATRAFECFDVSSEEHVVYGFGAFELDARRRLLFFANDKKAVSLKPKALDLLLFLVEHRGQVVEKSVLLDAVWPGVIVEENNLTQAISNLRRALGEGPQEHRFIATVPGRGYEFVADVRVSSAAPASTSTRPEEGVDEETPDGQLPDSSRSRLSYPSLKGSRTLLIAVSVVTVAVILSVSVLYHPQREASPAQTGAFRITGNALVGGTTAGRTQPTFSPDGSRAAFVSSAEGIPQIFVVNLERGIPLQLTRDSSGASHPSWSPLDDRIVYQSGSGGIFTIDPMGTLPPRMIIAEGVSPSFSWDGQSIVFELGSEIRLANVDGSGQRTVVGVPFGDRRFVRAHPALSPDGSQIAFFQQRVGPLGDYWIVPTAGGQARQLTFDLHWGGRPAWMPDGAHIVFPSKRGGTLTLWIVAATGGEPEPLTAGLGADNSPAVSRDGRRILYSTTRIESLFVVTDPETGEEGILARSRRLFAFPRVSPDGRTIAYFSEIKPREQIMTMSLDGTAIEQITEYRTDEANVFPRWSADGRSIYYYQNLPPTSLRRIPLAGGPHEEVLREFSWDLNPDLELSPTGDRVAFIRVDPDSRQRRLVLKNLDDGDEFLLPPGIQFAPSWSDDEQYLLGTAPNVVLICPTSGAECAVIFNGVAQSEPSQAEEALGHFAQWSSDQSSVFFTRRTANPVVLALWVIGRDGSDARHLFDYGPVHPLAGRFQVLPGDVILWDRYEHDESELVLATLSRSNR